MRLAYIALAAAVTLLASVNADSAAHESVAKKSTTITSPEIDDTLEGTYVQSGGKKFLEADSSTEDSEEDDDSSSTEDSEEDDDGFSSESDSGSADQEERGIGDALAKLKKSKSFSDSTANKALATFFKKLTPKEYRIPDPKKIPARLRPLRID
jgi:hypothetical protein